MSAAVPRWAVRVVSAALALIGIATLAYGAAIGPWVGGFGLVLLVVGAVVLWLSGSHLCVASVVLCVCGSLLAIGGWVLTDSSDLVIVAPVLLGGLLVGGVGFGAALGATSASVDSAGGFSR